MTADGRLVLRVSCLFALLALTGCTRLPSGSQPPGTGSGTTETTSIEAIVGPLRKKSDLPTCRTVLQQANAHLSAAPAAMTYRLEDRDAAFLRKSLFLSDDELNEISSVSFTLLDSHHLEQCFVMHDAARSLEVDDAPAEVRATAAFAWVMRQVQLSDQDKPLIPPLAVLRRGWGTAEQRGLVFLALLEQLDVSGCIVLIPGAGEAWLVGVLTGKEILLFDARTGFPVSSADGRKIATLAQLRVQPKIQVPLDSTGKVVAPQDARAAGPKLVCSLSAMAPRMRFLEESLCSTYRVRLNCDVHRLYRMFKEFADGAGPESIPVGFLSRSNDPDQPVQVLRGFLAPEEGGSDDSRWRNRQWQLTLTPWAALPPPVRQVPENIEPGIRLRNVFEQPFLDLIQTSGQPRDLLIRGRLAECVTRLVEIREENQRHLTVLRDEPNLDKELAAWSADAERLHGDLLLARRQAAAVNNPANLAALEQAERQMKAHWEKWDRVREVVLRVGAVPLAREIDYFLALAKHEQAERAQARLERRAEKPAELAASARESWQSAAERWLQYLDNPVPSWPTAGAFLNRARAMEMLGDRDAARSLLEAAAANERGWNEKALRHAIQQIQVR
jgi:hypothetical protein